MTPYLPQYSGIWEISILIGHLHLLVNYNKWKITFSGAWRPGMNLWTTTHRPVYMWAPAAAAAFCPTNKPPCAFNNATPNKLHIGCEYFGCESFNYKTCMNKNKHNNIKTQTSADVGIGNGRGLWGGCMIPANVSHIICTAVSYGVC